MSSGTPATGSRPAPARFGAMRLGAMLVVAMACAISAGAARAQSVGDFYRGKTISIYTHTPSGAYDLSARLIARGLQRHLPGNPTVIIRQMIGANSLIAANYVYNVAPKDGTAIWAGARLAPFASLFGITDQIRYDITKVHWLGSTASENGVVVAWHTAPHKTAADLFTKELVIGATVPGADTYLYPYALNKLIGTKFKIVGGYSSPGPIALAIEQGEVQGTGSWSWSNLIASYPQYIEEKKVRILMQLGLDKIAELPDVPLATEYAKSDEDRAILDILMGMRQFSYPFFVAPDVPADRVAALQKAFAESIRDEDFLADAKRQGRPVGMTTSEPLIQAYTKAYALPPQSVERLREAVNPAKE